MYNHNKAQQSKNHVHISWDILYDYPNESQIILKDVDKFITWLCKNLISWDEPHILL